MFVSLFLTTWFAALPEATLAAIVTVAVSGMVRLEKFRQLLHSYRTDFILSGLAFVAVLTLEAMEALLLSVICSLVVLIWRSCQINLAVLGRVDDRFEFVDTSLNPDAQTFPGLLMVRPSTGLFFANAEEFRQAIVLEVQKSATSVKAILIDLSATNDLDAPSADAITGLIGDLQVHQLVVLLTRVSESVRSKLLRARGYLEGNVEFYASNAEALICYLYSDKQFDNIDKIIKSGTNAVRGLASVYREPPRLGAGFNG